MLPWNRAVLADFIREGHLARHIRRMRMLYMERNDALVTEINKQLGITMEIVSAQAGMHLVGLLPDGVEDTMVWQRAARAGIASWPLSICFQRKPHRGGLVLGYGGVDRKTNPRRGKETRGCHSGNPVNRGR